MRIASRRRYCSTLALALVWWGACEGRASRLAGQSQDRRPDERLVYVDMRAPEVVQRIESEDREAERAKFVRVEIASVQNPSSYPVSFRIEYRPATGDAVTLGHFSLFPSDNPGKFIVATSGRLRTGGSVVLSLVKPDNAKADDVLRVGVRRMTFVNEGD